MDQGFQFDLTHIGFEHRELVFMLGVTDSEHHRESVFLSLGQNINPLLFDGILSRQDPEGIIQFEGVFSQCDLTLLHGFQQGALGFWGRSIDLIRQ